MQITRPVRVWTQRPAKRLSARVIGISAAMLLAGCSKGNPDALTGMNLDENAAMMNAPANQEANAAEVATASANAGSAPDSNRTTDTTATISMNRASRDEAQASGLANTAAPDEDNPPADSSDNQSEQNEAQPLGSD